MIDERGECEEVGKTRRQRRLPGRAADAMTVSYLKNGKGSAVGGNQAY